MLIIASVFVAIALESAWQNHQQAEAAHEALLQMLDDLQQDLQRLDVVVVRQREIDGEYQQMREWLREPATLDGARMQKYIEGIAYSSPTFFVRRSAWTTMVSGGHLQMLGDAQLVRTMADLYENQLSRLDFNNDIYDKEMFTVMRETLPRVWDFDRARLTTDDPAAARLLAAQLRYLHLAWNRWYIEFLGLYRQSLETLIAEVEDYLRDHGHLTGTAPARAPPPEHPANQRGTG